MHGFVCGCCCRTMQSIRLRAVEENFERGSGEKRKKSDKTFCEKNGVTRTFCLLSSQQSNFIKRRARRKKPLSINQDGHGNPDEKGGLGHFRSRPCLIIRRSSFVGEATLWRLRHIISPKCHSQCQVQTGGSGEGPGPGSVGLRW